ncbi:hypothetical protein [Stenotrophomonas muris]|uniref:hypothetical protein n=1 Tax=Stenotrophomonas muris TaxID=2963283 RepID=UPI001F52FB32
MNDRFSFEAFHDVRRGCEITVNVVTDGSIAASFRVEHGSTLLVEEELVDSFDCVMAAREAGFSAAGTWMAVNWP